MDFRSLRHLLTVQETGSLNKAAAQIGVSQPALSKTIHRLEAEIGAPLFERQSRGVRPTIYGSRLLEFARATCVAFDQSLAELRDIKSGATGAVTIYGPPLVAGQLFPAIFSAVKLRFPNLRLRFEVRVDHLVEALMDGKADLVVGTLTSETLKQSVQCLPLFEEELVLICKRGHPVTRLKPLTAKGLSEFDWVFSAPGNRHRNKLERFFEAAGVPIPRPLAETSSPALIRSLVMRSNAIALLPRMGVGDNLDHVKMGIPSMARSIGLLWRANFPISAATQNVLKTIRDLFEGPRKDTPNTGSGRPARSASRR